jgi:hypothetical protein
MAEAQKHDGKAIVAYRNGQAIDSDGNVIKGAPKPPKDTDPSQQIGRANALSPEERMAAAVASAVLNPQAALARAQFVEASTAAATDDDEGEDTEESDELPALADMPAHLASITDVDELKALKKQDKRKGGKALIQSRIDVLKGAE